MPVPDRTADLIILGAGPAGLAAAGRAARAGHDVVVLERAPYVGGATASFDVAGVMVDQGSHRLHPTVAPEILSDLRRLLGDRLQRRPRNGRIRLAGRWIRFPLAAADLVRHLPPGFVAAAARDAATSWARRPREDTFAEVLRAGLGPTMCERFYFPYGRKVWGLEPHELSGEQARRRVSADSPAKLLRRILPGGADGDRGVFYYPRGGFGAIARALADDATAAGADIRVRTAARRLELAADRVRVETDTGAVLRARRLWSTVPLPTLARMATPAPPARVLEAAGRLAYRAMVLVYPVLAGGRFTPFDAHYLPEAGTPVTRVSEPANYRHGDDPTDRTVLCAEIPCQAGDALYRAGEAELARVVADGLRQAGLPLPAPADVTVRRLSHAYPICARGFEQAFAVLDAWAGGQPALLTFGRQGLFVHDNTHHTLAMAWAATEALSPGGDFDQAAWAAARRRFSAHVVED